MSSLRSPDFFQAVQIWPSTRHPCSFNIISDCFFLSCAVSACTTALVPSEIVSSATGVRRNTFILPACHTSPQTFLSRIGRQRQRQGKGTQEKQRDFPRIVRPTRVACLSLLASASTHGYTIHAANNITQHRTATKLGESYTKEE